MSGGFFVEGDEVRPQQPRQQQQQQATRPGCTRCSSLTWNQEWLEAFGVRLCNQCKREEPLVSKTTAKQRYYVTDNDLRKLGSLRKANPHKKDWQQMHLYMQSQVEAVSHEKHGGAEGLEEHQQRLLDHKLQERIKKREGQKRKEEVEAEQRDRFKRRMEEEEARRVVAQQQALQQQIAAAVVEVEEI
ncbi:hypothetical protein N2152v2_004362 [Parachlorella kessleri]